MARLKTWLPTDKLECRLSGQEVSGITLAIPSGPVATVTGERLIAALFSQPNRLPVPGGIHRSLFLEALLLDEGNAPTIAGLASRQHEKELGDTVKSLQNPGSTAAQQKPVKAPNALIGRLPDPGFPIKWHGNPWIPLFLVWEVSWQSAYASPAASDDALSQDLLTSLWNLGDNAGGDLILKDKGPYPAGSAGAASYQGYAILTASTANNLAQRLEALDQSHPLVNILRTRGCWRKASTGSTTHARFDLSLEGGSHTGLIMTKLYRHNNEWKMQALGESAEGRTFHDLLPTLRPYL